MVSASMAYLLWPGATGGSAPRPGRTPGQSASPELQEPVLETFSQDPDKHSMCTRRLGSLRLGQSRAQGTPTSHQPLASSPLGHRRERPPSSARCLASQNIQAGCKGHRGQREPFLGPQPASSALSGPEARQSLPGGRAGTPRGQRGAEGQPGLPAGPGVFLASPVRGSLGLRPHVCWPESGVARGVTPQGCTWWAPRGSQQRVTGGKSHKALTSPPRLAGVCASCSYSHGH